MTRLGSVGRLVALVAVCGSAVSHASAGEWEEMRDRLDEKIRSQAGRVSEIDASQRGDPADPTARADKITRDRIARATAALNRGGRVRSLAAAAETGATDRSAITDIVNEQSGQLEAALRDWGSAGPERRKLRDAVTAAQKNVERATASLAQASDVADAVATRLAESGVAEAVGRIESEASEAGERLRARWQREWDARERERLFRERAAGERERGVR